MPNILPHTSSPATLHTQAKLTPDVSSVHLANELVDVGLAVAEVTTLNVVLELRLYPATVGVRELDGPEEVGGLQIYMSLCVINMLRKFDRPA